MTKQDKINYFMATIETATGMRPVFQRNKGARISGFICLDLPEWTVNLENIAYGIGYYSNTSHIANLAEDFFEYDCETGTRLEIFNVK
jgi:hypothetical protein